MSYSGLGSLGSLAAATYPINTQLAAGYRIAGLTRPAGEVPGLLREAMQAAFRGATLRTGWGGGSGSAGVPSGHVYAVVETRMDGVTADVMNGIFSQVARDLQTRLGGGTVTNTHGHVVRLGSAGSSAARTAADIATALTTPGTATPGTETPSDVMPPSYLPPPSIEEGSFFTRSVGGIPMWGILAGGVVVLGGLGFVLLSPRRSSQVKQNRRRRRS